MEITQVSTTKRVIDRSANYRESIYWVTDLAWVMLNRKTSWDPKNSPRDERNCLRLTSRGGVDKDPSGVTPLMPDRTHTQTQTTVWRSGLHRPTCQRCGHQPEALPEMVEVLEVRACGEDMRSLG